MIINYRLLISIIIINHMPLVHIILSLSLLTPIPTKKTDNMQSALCENWHIVGAH